MIDWDLQCFRLCSSLLSWSTSFSGSRIVRAREGAMDGERVGIADAVRVTSCAFFNGHELRLLR